MNTLTFNFNFIINTNIPVVEFICPVLATIQKCTLQTKLKVMFVLYIMTMTQQIVAVFCRF